MAEGTRSRWTYDATLAAAATAGAALARWAADPLLGDRLQFLTFFAAIVLSAALRGRRCGVLATVLAALVGTYLFMPPRWTVWPRDPLDFVTMLLFVLVGGFITWVAGGMHETRQRSIRVLAERRQAEDQLRNVVESAPNALVMADHEGVIVLVNAQAERCFGYDRQEMIGQPVEMLVPERFRGPHPGYRHGFMAAPQARPMGAGRDLFGRRKDGTDVPVEIGLSPIHTDQGTFVLASIVDITERKRAEEAIHQAAEELRRSNLDLEQFAYVASHDLQEPLRQVAGFVQLLRDRYQGKFDQDADEYLAFAVDGAKRMSTLIKGLLDYSRAGARAQDPEPVACEEAFVMAMDNLRNAAVEAGAKITYDALPTVQANIIQLTQVFQNLIGNAIKFRRQGVAPEVHVGCRRDGAMWRLSVADSGIGIPADQVDRMFQVFQRLHGRDKYPGTGIGLAICKKIVERYGGRIWVDSSQNGTTFYFTLPAADAPAPPVPR